MNFWSMLSVAAPYVPSAIIGALFLMSRQTVLVGIFGFVAIVLATDRAARAETARHVVDQLTGKVFDGDDGPPPPPGDKHE